MLRMRAVDLIEKRYLDTGIIEHNEIMELFSTIRNKDQQLKRVANTAKLGGQNHERTVN